MTKAIAMLKDQVDRNIFTYVDDIVVANKKKFIHIKDVTETFTSMREAKLKLNPEKCVFVVHKEKVLSCLVSVKGIEANPDKIKAIMHMKPEASTIKERCTKVDCKNCGFKQIHSEASRTEPFFLYSVKRLRHF
jgi:hypothetical protein